MIKLCVRFVIGVLAFGWLGSIVQAGGGTLSLLMGKAGLSSKQIEYAMELPTDYNLSKDLEKILPGEFIVFSDDGRKGVIYIVKDTLRGKVFYDLNNRIKK